VKTSIQHGFGIGMKKPGMPNTWQRKYPSDKTAWYIGCARPPPPRVR